MTRIRLLRTLLITMLCIHAPTPFALAERSFRPAPVANTTIRKPATRTADTQRPQARAQETAGNTRSGMLFVPRSMEGLVADGNGQQPLTMPGQLVTFGF